MVDDNGFGLFQRYNLVKGNLVTVIFQEPMISSVYVFEFDDENKTALYVRKMSEYGDTFIDQNKIIRINKGTLIDYLDDFIVDEDTECNFNLLMGEYRIKYN